MILETRFILILHTVALHSQITSERPQITSRSSHFESIFCTTPRQTICLHSPLTKSGSNLVTIPIQIPVLGLDAEFNNLNGEFEFQIPSQGYYSAEFFHVITIFEHDCPQGRVTLPNQVNIRKSSKGGVIFNPKIHIADCGPLQRFFSNAFRKKNNIIFRS